MSEHIVGQTLGGAEWLPKFVQKLDAGRCIGCGRCYKVCSRAVLELVERAELAADEDDYDDPFGDDDDDDGFADDTAMVMSLKNRQDCIGCEACSKICPKNCFSLAAAPRAAAA